MSNIRYALLMIFLLAPLTVRAADVDQLQAELDAMRHRIDQQDQVIASQNEQLQTLRGEAGDSWLNQRRQEQVRELVHEVLADADTRASLMDDGMTAGWNNGFFLASADGSFYLRVMGMVQARHTWSLQDNSADVAPSDVGDPDDPNDDRTDDSRAGFGLTRTRYGFKGHVVDPSWQFLLWAGYNCEGEAVVLDAYVTKQINDNWSLTVGQFKLPYLYEYLVSETRLQLIERSLIAGRFCGTYTQGVMLTYENDMFRLRLSANDGASTINTIWHERTTEYAFTGRAEAKIAGDWKDYTDWEGWPGQNMLLIVGAAIHHEIDEYGTVDDEVENTRWTVDASLEGSGFNLFVALVGNHFSGATDLDQIGVVIQGGFFVTDKLELIARYEWSDPDLADEDNLSVATVGFSWFFNRHQVRWTSDIGYAFNAVGDTYDSRALGWRLDSAGEDGQVVMRNQIQLLF
jgi:hypothetical protein